jgi:ribosomal protein S18 acetylase RimI-like enzyme
MKTDPLPDLIENNLYSLYRGFALAGNYALTELPSYSWIKTDLSVFPGNVFQIDPGMDENALSDLVGMIKEDQVSPFLIFRNDKVDSAFIERLKTKGFRQVMHWPGMALPLQHNHKWTVAADLNITVKKIRNTEEIGNWAGMVEQILFNGKGIDRKVLKSLILTQELCLYTGYIDGIPAGTLLLWTRDQVAGLYMITTLPAFRHKGVAWQITNTAIRDAAVTGYHYAVLESTPQGLSLYRKAGFLEYCSFSIYWMLGKNK